MKIKIFGFEPDPRALPPAVGANAGFEWLRDVPGFRLNKTLTAACVSLDGYWAGVLLRARDAKSFMRMKREGGLGTLKSEKLLEGEQLAEANFFVVHPKTGRGLYSYHYKSASMRSEFAFAAAKLFAIKRKYLLQDRLEDPGVKWKDHYALRQEHKGKWSLNELLHEGDLKSFLKSLKRISQFEATFTAFDLKEDIFDPLSKQASRKSVSLIFPPNAAMHRIELAIEEAEESNNLDDFWITGKDRMGSTVDFHKKRNPLLFGEYDYDDLMTELEISFSDWSASIANAEVTKKLLAIAKGRQVATMLGAV